MNVVLTKAALADLDEIAAFIARDDPLRADRFVERLRQKCATLSRHARRHPMVGQIASRDVRKLSYRNYLILYAVRERQVDILRIVHGARDWAELLG